MTMQLHYYPSTAAMIPHIMLEEIGVPYERVLVDRLQNAHKAPGYLKLNPNGLIPVLTDGALVLYETAAIVLHLCDTQPQARLAPANGTPQRAEFYKWLMWLTNTLQATMIVYFYPERLLDAGNIEGAAQVKAAAHTRIVGLMQQLDALVARNGGPWLLGAGYSGLDAYAFTMCRWTRNFAAGKARELPQLGPYARRMLERPAVQRVLVAEQLSEPFV
ncbi:MAG: Glutathione S-transferase (Glutathione transferase)-like protein [Ramlibacter sp.]|jgi:glutathione S-transferase|uniref:glutathione S-transferase family protein n=1 Tax=Ramlibacter sp. TaxID=1917967 RepID=UPI002634E5AD|nr:glutathione S-transferase family protein [Ramlibacter sp.]MDB5752185.1 Glutathione S-transferase (Glutathione transferase)-like protein [Ramlibacter sp.]